MGFAQGFAYDSAADIFREYAALTDFANDGARDLDLGAHAEIGREHYEALEPFQWPQPKRAGAAQARFFAEGGFFTPDRRARFVPVTARAQPRTSEAYPLTLNTGRVRDHWHTMTRTGKSPRLSAHVAEPFAELHPADAARFGIADADIVRVESICGAVLVRALLTDRQRRGSVFVPMHWTDQFASQARVNALAAPLTDPQSGQPALKNIAVCVSKFAAAAYGFAICREKPVTGPAAYWALAKCKGGWRIELATEAPIEDPLGFAAALFGADPDVQPLSYQDREAGRHRLAFFDGGHLVGALYLARDPVGVPRNWAVEQLSAEHPDSSARLKVIAGRPGADMPDKGAIVCSCFSVGSREIAAAARAGCASVDAVGRATHAGTNCGSCRAEIKVIIEKHALIAAE